MIRQIDSKRGRAVLAVALASGATLVALSSSLSLSAAAPKAPVQKPAGETIGLVLTDWRYALVETPRYTECQDGLQPGEVAQLKATPGAVERIEKDGGWFEARGPNGETGHNSPDKVVDPLPWHELITKTGFGANLDGTQDGKATPKTCKHEKFTSADGEKVDNQTARVYGCVMGYRVGGQVAEELNSEITGFPVDRYLIEITGVTDEMNTPSVDVYFYKGFDRVVRTSDNKYIAGLSSRIDARYPQYNMHTKGKIVNGVLITDPISRAVMPYSTERIMGDRDFRDMTLRLKFRSDGADGILSGYDNWSDQYLYNSKRFVAELSKYSNPSIYRAFQRYADGYPDPKTGQCQYISAAYKISAVRAMIVHPSNAHSAVTVARN